jgi:hypothetical protein
MRIVSGYEKDCPQKRNGRKPAEAFLGMNIPGETIGIVKMQMSESIALSSGRNNWMMPGSICAWTIDRGKILA